MSDWNPRELCDKYHPEALMLVCYMPCWPFEAEWCSHCQEIAVYWGSVKTFAWNLLIGWWWSGRVQLLERATFPKKWRRDDKTQAEAVKRESALPCAAQTEQAENAEWTEANGKIVRDSRGREGR